MSETLSPGLAAPHETQSCFRLILHAMSRPGSLVAIEAALAPPPPLSIAAAAALLTLADATTGIALPDAGQAAPWLVFHTGARIVTSAEADFVVARTPDLAACRAGTDEAPECGATLILDLAALGEGRPLRLTGPGIDTTTLLRAPLDDDFLARWRRNRAMSPRGVDVLLCAGRRLAALPRSVTIEVA